MASHRHPPTLFALFTLFSCLFASVAATARSFNDFISYDNEFLDPNYILSKKWNTSATADAQQTILAWADNLMAQGPWSVTQKMPGFVADKHDYASLAPYWHADCSKVGNKTALTPQQIWVTCPYVDIDGVFTPDYRIINDTGNFAGLCDTVMLTSVAWVISGDDNYAQRAVSLVNTWFLDPDTYMNPNLNHAQIIRGVPLDQQKGTHYGVLDFKNSAKLVSGLLILRQAKYPGWTSDMDSKLIAWAKQYITWLETNQLGIDEGLTANNHGTYFYNQLAAWAIFSGDNATAQKYLERYFTTQYLAQIAANGEQPLEADRSRTYHYRAYNLGAMITNSKIAAYIGYDTWNITTKAGARIVDALNWAMKFDPAATNEVTSAPAPELYQHVAAVGAVYGDPDGKYAAYLAKVDPIYPQSPYFLWNQPLALPQNYAVSPAPAGGSTQTGPKTLAGASGPRFMLPLSTFTWAATLLLCAHVARRL